MVRRFSDLYLPYACVVDASSTSRGMFMKSMYTILFVYFLVSLSACAPKNAETIVLQEHNPFAAMGLLAHPGETAEEILLRAHAYEPRAKATVSIGYLYGIGGFPQNDTLASLWGDSFLWVRPVPYTDDLLYLMRNANTRRSTTAILEHCYTAQKSDLAPLLKEAGLFDVESWCAQTDASFSSYSPDTKGTAADGMIEYLGQMRTLIVELFDRAMTKREEEFLTVQAHLHERLLVDYIATGGKEDVVVSPKERTGNFLRFIAQRKRAYFSHDASPASEGDTLHTIAVNGLMSMQSGQVYVPHALEIIRKAHSGDPEAALQMSENYRTGAMGFIVNPALAAFWMKSSLETGNSSALDYTALYTYARSSPLLMSNAWLEARIGLQYGNPELKDFYSWIIKEAEKDIMKEEWPRLRRELQEESRRMEALGYKPHSGL